MGRSQLVSESHKIAVRQLNDLEVHDFLLMLEKAAESEGKEWGLAHSLRVREEIEINPELRETALNLLKKDRMAKERNQEIIIRNRALENREG